MTAKTINENRFYVYVYLDPRKPGKYTYDGYNFDYEPFYIGKGTGKRKYEHIRNLKSSKSSYKKNKIIKILSFKIKPIIIIIQDKISDYESKELEIKLINLIGRIDLKKGPLTNLTNGGDGASGVVFSKELREKISNRTKGENNVMYGKKHSKKSIEKIRNSRIEKIKSGEIIPAKHTEDWKIKMRNENPSSKKVDDNLIIKLNKEGKTNVEISKLTGITLRIIYNRLKKYGLTRNKNKNDKIIIDIELVHEFISQGKSYKDIAEILNVSETCISRNYRNSKYYTKKRNKWDLYKLRN